MTITLFENFRAVFYTPFYASVALDAYGAEGADVRLETSSNPETTAQALLNGEADVSWGGPMRILHYHDKDPNCGLVGFAEVVTRDPFFLIGREPRPDFTMQDLTNCRIATVSEVPTPWLCLQDDLRRAGLNPDKVERISNRTMAENEAALRDGSIDAIQVFQPFAEHLIRDGVGHIWYAAASRGPCSYTTLYTTTDALQSKRDTLQAMARAIYRTQKWLHSKSPATVAACVADYFPDLDPDVLTACIARYISLGAYGSNPLLPRDGFERLTDACLSGGLIQRGAAYENCVDTEAAKKAIEANPPSM
jgi:NitT/TauT family transport system substrate-binding protein